MRARPGRGGRCGAHFIGPSRDAAAAVPTTAATGPWRGDSDRCCLKAAGQRNFLVASGDSYFDAGSEPCWRHTFRTGERIPLSVM